MLLNSAKLSKQQPSQKPPVHGLSNTASVYLQASLYTQLNGLLGLSQQAELKQRRTHSAA